MAYIYWGTPLVMTAIIIVVYIILKNKRKCGMPESFNLVLTDWDRKLMAYHEAGHAVCSFYMPEREVLIKISIEPSSDAFGMIQTKQRLHHNETEISMKSSVATFLAGRIAEEIFCNAITTSCIHDLQAAHHIARDMVVLFGMGKKSGMAALSAKENFQPSQRIKEEISCDIQQIIIEAETKARELLLQHRFEVAVLAEKLLIGGTLYQNEIEELLKVDLKTEQ